MASRSGFGRGGLGLPYAVAGADGGGRPRSSKGLYGSSEGVLVDVDDCEVDAEVDATLAPAPSPSESESKNFCTSSLLLFSASDGSLLFVELKATPSGRCHCCIGSRIRVTLEHRIKDIV